MGTKPSLPWPESDKRGRQAFTGEGRYELIEEGFKTNSPLEDVLLIGCKGMGEGCKRFEGVKFELVTF
jgi:hypothetical protein